MIETLGYQTVLTLHIVSFFYNITLVVLSDALGLLWVLGKKEILGSYMYWLHKLIWFGLAVSVVTGVALFSESTPYLLRTPAFLVKVSFVLVLVINSFFLLHHINIITTQPFSEVAKSIKRKMFIGGLVSTVSWVAVVIAATQLGL